MGIPFDELLADFSSGDIGAQDNALRLTEEVFGKQLPCDYKEFLAYSNGGEGYFGKHYLILWKTDELGKFNKEYQVLEYAAGLILFGSNGGGEGFAFDTRVVPYKVVLVPFVGMDLQHAIPVADSFVGLLERMIRTDGPLI